MIQLNSTHLASDAPKRVLIISHDVVDVRMAGPGIRYWQLARVLAHYCEVTLAVPKCSKLSNENFTLQPYDIDDWDSLKAAVNKADVIMPCGFVIRQFPQLTDVSCPIVIDGYDPYLFETLASYKSRPDEVQAEAVQTCLRQLESECLRGDFFLCACARQRYWWLGMLQAYGRVNMATFLSDPTLENLLAVVPFGYVSDTLVKTRPVIRGVTPNIDADSKVLLWGGGIWEWTDPLTLLRAMRHVIDQVPDARLVFPGTRHPNSQVSDSDMQRNTKELARDLGLIDKHVFFSDWVPYSDWQNYLLEADIGVSLHFNSIETQMAFRSRILDYIRGALPMIVTDGDATSELVSNYGLGTVVGYQDVEGVSTAILQLLDEPRYTRTPQFKSAQANLTWEKVAQPLIAFCSNPHRAADYQADELPLQALAMRSSSPQTQQLMQEQAHLKSEVEQLHKLVNGYERGRFMRLMRSIRHLRAKVHIP